MSMAFAFVSVCFLVLLALASLVLLPGLPWAFAGAAVMLTALYAVAIGRSFNGRLARQLGIRLAAFFLGSFRRTYVTETDMSDLRARYGRAGRTPELETVTARGLAWLGLPDIVYLQWPFYSAVPVTTAQLRIAIAVADGIWTTEQELFRLVRTERTVERARDPQKPEQRGRVLSNKETTTEGPWRLETATEKKSTIARRRETRIETPDPTREVEITVEETVETRVIPRVQLEVNGEVFIRLGVDLGRLFLALPDAPLGTPTGENGLEGYLQKKIEPLIQEAIRDAVAGFTRRRVEVINGQELVSMEVVPGLTWEGIADAIRARRELETRVRELLGSQPESILIQSGLLRPWDGRPDTHDGGQTASAFDVVIENIVPKDAELQKAIDAVAIARKQAEAATFEGTATRQREKGLTDALRERQEVLQTSGESVLAHDFGKNTKADLTLVAPDLASVLATLLKKRRS